MEKISWKKELHFVRYSISKFMDFSKFLGTFFDFEHIHKNTPLIFLVKNYKNTPLMFEV